MSESKPSQSIPLKLACGVLAAVIIIYVAFFWWVWRLLPANEGLTPSITGQIGDTFAILGCLLSSLTFAFLILTIWNQYQVSRMQQTSLEEARQASATAEKDRAVQLHEDAFFRLLEHFDHIIADLKVCKPLHPSGAGPKMPEASGRAVFRYYLEESEHSLKRNYDSISAKENITVDLEKDAVHRAFSTVWEEAKDNLPHYIQCLTQIMRYIDSDLGQDVLRDRQYVWAAILRSSLSQYELAFIFYTCLFVIDSETYLKPLIERYAIFSEDVWNPLNIIIACDTLAGQYAPEAFVTARNLA